MKSTEKDFRQLDVVNRIPVFLSPDDSEVFPREMQGAKIIQIGCPEDSMLLEGGGLVIDYQPETSNDVRRLVLSFNASGAWVEFDGRLADDYVRPESTDLLRFGYPPDADGTH